MTFDISLHEVCVRVSVIYVITKFSRMDSLPNFLTHGAPQARVATKQRIALKKFGDVPVLKFLQKLALDFPYLSVIFPGTFLQTNV